MEPTSQQELKQLFDEGKISEEEYQELKQVMAEKKMGQTVEQEKGENKPDSVHKLGKIALILVLVGFVFPALGYFLFDFVAGPNASPELMPFYFLFGAIELTGFMMGVVSWRDGFGKAAAITAGTLLLLSVLFVA